MEKINRRNPECPSMGGCHPRTFQAGASETDPRVRSRFWPIALGLFVCGFASPFPLPAQSERGVQFFETKIRPILVKHCYECHSKGTGKSKGGLRLDTRASMFAGGESGPAIVPRSLPKSLLYQSLLYGDDSPQMPPKGKLPDSVIDDFREWIRLGAPDPRVAKIQSPVQSGINIETGRNYWAYQPVNTPRMPSGEGFTWARTSIDRFVWAKLNEKGLRPVEDASPALLIRRLYLVLTGLPPSVSAMDQWSGRLNDAADIKLKQKVFAELVDQLLDSPRYGERWGRHWMDVARFAESTGGDQNNIYQHAWRYRDYVIDSFNADKPFDRFIREQIAGDLLPIANDREWSQNVIATGFLAIGVKLVGEVDQQKFFSDLVDEQIDTTTRAFLATTVSCARCHDHKFDPIPQRDYFALAGIFRSTATHYGLLKAQARQATTLLDLTGMGATSGSPKLDRAELARLKEARDDAVKAINDAMAKIRSGENVFRGMLRRLRSQRDETEAALQAYTLGGEARVFAMGTQDRDHPLTTRLLVRGELDKPAQVIPRGVLQVASPPNRHSIPSRTTGSGRMELANWIAWDKNPLTARVIANRTWHWMFGRGLVRTVDDFGKSGERPTHPELLDYLANRLVENGWSIKSLIREIALSRTWQLASLHHPKNFSVDPENHLIWRMSKRRLEAEALRDAILTVSGTIELERPLGTLLQEVGEGGVGQNVFEPVIRSIESNRRSVYLPRVRGVLPEVLELFDAPDAGLVAGARSTTSSPLQALFQMNHPWIAKQATALADRVATYPRDRQIEKLYLILFGRKPTEKEHQLGEQFIVSDRAPDDELSTLAAYCQALLCTGEFQTIE